MLDETGAYLTMAENRPNVPKHCHGISLREGSAVADAFKELSTRGEFETEVVTCVRLEPLVNFDLQRKGKGVRR
jgi:hypothetical protein